VVTDAGLQAFRRFDTDEKPAGKLTSKYIVASRTFEDLLKLEHSREWTRVSRPEGFAAWTDDYSSMVSLFF
jgi:hypothetical protein